MRDASEKGVRVLTEEGGSEYGAVYAHGECILPHGGVAKHSHRRAGGGAGGGCREGVK